MNTQLIFQQIKNHYWQFQTNGWQSLKMGANGGILAISFHADGSLGFPTKMDFLPNYKSWNWDDQLQVIQIIDSKGEVVIQLAPPYHDEYKLVLKEIDSDNTFVSYYLLESYMDNLWAPTPLLDNNELVSVNQRPLIIKSGSTQNNYCDEDIQLFIIDSDWNEVSFWYQAYNYLIEHPNSGPICLILKATQLDDEWLLNYNSDKLIIVDNQNGNFQMIHGSRSLILDLMTELVFQLRSEELLKKTPIIMEILSKLLRSSFEGRYQFI